MKKYIDADLLRKKITEEMESVPREVGRGAGTITSKGYGMMQAFQIVRSIIDSLQHEQPEDSKGKFVFPKFLYARTTDNKTIDVSYVPQDMTAIEYVRNDSVEQEQPEVDLNDEIKKFIEEYGYERGEDKLLIAIAARHFFELGKTAREEGSK